METPAVNNAAFLLAHDVVDWDTDLHTKSRLWDGFSILDNSVIELGGAVDLNMVREAAQICIPTVVVLPDVLESGKGTTEAVLNAEEWFVEFKNNYQPLAGHSELMFVPQGRDMAEWLECLETVMTHYKRNPPKWIGIARNTTGRIVQSRLELVRIVKALYPWAKIHLLGFSDNLTDDMLTAKYGDVFSIDSAVPLRLAHQEKKMTLSADPGPRGNWWTQDSFTPLHAENVETFNRWIN